jgi:hypothetical protein
MATLSKEYRKLLENVVAAARIAAVAGARKALVALRVGDKDAPVEPERRVFRNQLRAHGRQLGDRLQSDGTQETARLEQACAYEHWHRMLFARFLAENDLLLNPEYQVAMSLTEIQEDARGKGQDWLSVASDYAQRMLIEVFRPDDPVLQVVMPPETRQELDEKLAQLPPEIFLAEDSLGWVYQFWQRDEKERVNKSEVKIGADELSPVTQLFTEDYMVLFLLHNTLGAWWTAKRRAEGKDSTLPNYDWTYLRFNEDGSPAAGGFLGWPKTVRDLKLLDPCMGSGHFLAFALPILAYMRMEEEGLCLTEAIHGVLSQNLFGLELDPRCSQIAAFNLALTAWRLIGHYDLLPTLNLACAGLGINASETDWTTLAKGDERARHMMQKLYSLFRQAPSLGSLIDPTRFRKDLFSSDLNEVSPLLRMALESEQSSDERKELAVAAQGLLASAQILADRFTLVATNVPYLGRGRQNEDLAKYCEEFYSDSKADLASSFVDRAIQFCVEGGTAAIVTKQEPLFLGQFKQQRRRLLTDVQWDFVCRLGPRAFETITGERVTVALLCLTRRLPPQDHLFTGWDVTDARTPSDKALRLLTVGFEKSNQSEQTRNPDSRVVFGKSEETPLLRDYATALAGHLVGDSVRFERFFWELPKVSDEWEFLQSTVDVTQPHGGKSSIIFWEHEKGSMFQLAQSVKHLNHVAQNWLRGKPNWGKRGVLINQMQGLSATLYLGDIYDCNCCAIIPKDPENLRAIWAYCISEKFAENVRRLDQKMNVAPHTLLKVPFDMSYWNSVADELFPIGLPVPTSSDVTQWLFDGNPRYSSHPLQAAVLRLVGYRWPRQTGSCFPDCPSLGWDEIRPHEDLDGIVCLNSLSGEAPAADSLRTLLADVYGSEWSAAKLTELLGDRNSLELWLRDKFFGEHCEVFQSRPLVWHIWDGRKDGFHAFVNYHKLAGPHGEGRRTLERLIYTSLGDWISRQKAEVTSGADGAEARLAAALHLQTELENILRGEPPYDIFVRWKPLHEQAIGWEPDLNDGVRLNMRPWLKAKPYGATKKDACILRVTPIKLPLGKDRGKEPIRDETDFPWFADSHDRTNDIHLKLEEKRKARELKKA